MENFICKECSKETNSLSGLCIHIARNHNVKKYYDSFFKKTSEGFCLICNIPTSFTSIAKGYKKTCSKNCQNELNRRSLVSNCQFSKQYWRDRGLSEEEISMKFKEKSIWSKEYWEKRGHANGTELIKNIQAENGFKYSRKLKEFPDDYKNSFSTRIEFWLDRFENIDDAYVHYRNRQSTFSLKKCIAKYGEESGQIFWENRQLRWQETLAKKNPEEIAEMYKKKDSVSVSFFLSKGFSQEESVIKSAKRLRQWHNNQGRVSKESFKVLRDLKQLLDDNNITTKIMWNTKEYFLIDKETKKIFFYDFTILDKKIIVEYDGCAWHPDPNMDDISLSSIKLPFTDLTMLDKKIIDEKKTLLAEKNGFKLFRIYSKFSKNEIDSIFNTVLNLCV